METPQTPADILSAHWRVQVRGRRVSLVRRLALHFELRRAPGTHVTELRIYTDRRIYRWALPASLLHPSPAPAAQVAAELGTVAPGEPDDFLPLLDEGRWELSEGFRAVEQFRAAYARGEFSLLLRGRRVAAELGFQRTPMSVEGRPQWKVTRVRPAPRPAREQL